MKHAEKLKAKTLRESGYSLAEIVQKLHVSKSSASIWVRDIVLSKSARKRLATRTTSGLSASHRTTKAKINRKEEELILKARGIINSTPINISHKKIISALIYFCEGNKSIRGGVSFTNSDPGLMNLFLCLFRSSFDLDEKKFSICVHLHPYHDKDKQLEFWSKVTKIPISQFMKPWLKKNSDLYSKKDYQGCANIRYYSTDVARELKTFAIEYMKFI